MSKFGDTLGRGPVREGGKVSERDRPILLARSTELNLAELAVQQSLNCLHALQIPTIGTIERPTMVDTIPEEGIAG